LHPVRISVGPAVIAVRRWYACKRNQTVLQFRGRYVKNLLRPDAISSREIDIDPCRDGRTTRCGFSFYAGRKCVSRRCTDGWRRIF
jgi:hypothetical protein